MTTTTVGRQLTVQQASAMGYGHPDTIRHRIKSGALPAMRIDKRGTYGISLEDLERSDLAARSRAYAPGVLSDPAPPQSDDAFANALAARIVATWPRLSPTRKAELGRLLAVS
ncbi:hypothetical protein C8046_16745 [Serinibacter arcticus]|uniref:Helix-turn-helix domain-containing protein n=1 Tax=Serinibacter arcticus TaxID=1655435 RepID=A0A2U1ZYI4_9MICO|nr:hypothetical protein [Serinibacter arcticus]PWD52047.1 hypothetical protein C8046_16745 [Serinibacter arcticus]